MSVSQANGVCPAILIGLADLLAEDPNMFMTPIGGVQSTLDPSNTKGVTITQLTSENGHTKPVRIAYKHRAIESDIRDAKSCTTGSEKPYFEQLFNTNLHSEHVIEITEATVRTLCDAHSDWVTLSAANGSNPATPEMIGKVQVMREMALEVMSDLDAIRQDINKKFHTAVAMNIGAFQGGSLSNTYNVLKAADHALVLTGFNQFKQDMKKVNASSPPIVFGGGVMDLAIMAAGYGCCNAAGQDFSIMKNQGAGFKFYEDYDGFASYYGNANAFISYLPKTIQFATYNKYVGNFAKPIGTMSRGTMPDPALPGIKYDIRLLPSECDETYNLFINLDYDFYFAPNNLYASGDRLASVNGIFKGIAATI